MKQIKLNLPEEINNYLSLLSLNIESRKQLLDSFVDKYGINNSNVKLYMNEYYIYDAKYKMAQNKITAALNNLTNQIISWELIFATSTIQLSVQDNYTIPASVKKLITSGLFICIEDEVAETLTSIYNNENFTDNDGITENEETCTTCKSGGCSTCTPSKPNKQTKTSKAKKEKDVEVIPITEVGKNTVEEGK